MPDDDDRSEQLDDDSVGEEFPPERRLGDEELGAPGDVEPDEERPADRPVLLLDETEDGFGLGEGEVDETGDAMLGEAGDLEGYSSGGEMGLGPPPSLTAADRVPLSAEEAAVHVVDVGDA